MYLGLHDSPAWLCWGLPLQMSPHCRSHSALRLALGAHSLPTKRNMDKAHLSLPTAYLFISCEPRENTHAHLPHVLRKARLRLHQATCSPVEMIGKGGENPIFTFTLGLPSLIRAAGPPESHAARRMLPMGRQALGCESKGTWGCGAQATGRWVLLFLLLNLFIDK